MSPPGAIRGQAGTLVQRAGMCCLAARSAALRCGASCLRPTAGA